MPEKTLPSPRSFGEYRKVFRDESIWEPANRTIAARHGLEALPRRRILAGTHIVTRLGNSHIVKLFTPLFASHAAAEIAAMGAVAGKLPVATPAVVATGELEGWDYVVMTQLEGQPIGDLWPELDEGEKVRLAANVGELIRAQHALPIADLPMLDRHWPAFVRRQSAGAAERQAQNDLAQELVDEIPDYLAAAGKLDEQDSPTVLLHADLTHDNLFVRRQAGRWQLSACIDFGDAFLGHWEYDLLAPGLLIVRGAALPLRALLLASGEPAAALGPELRHKLMAYTLLHRYADLEWIRHRVPGGAQARTLGALAEVFWPLD